MIIPRGKLVRRFNENIFGNQKYDRLLKRKQEMPRFGRRPRRPSEFGRQLNEKQKLKFTYGLREKQFRIFFDRAKKMRGVAGHNFLMLLECRLDNVVYQSGMAMTRRQARQLVSHGHFVLNNNPVDVPSIVVKKGDVIVAVQRKNTADMIRKLLSQNSAHAVPPWIKVSPDDLRITVEGLPAREHITTTAEEQLIVEYYSR